MATIDVTKVTFQDPDPPYTSLYTVVTGASYSQSVAINKLLRTSYVNNGDQIYFPAGTYYLNRPLYKNNDNTPAFLSTTRHTWVGDGPGATVFKTVANGNYPTPIFDTTQTGGTASSSQLQFRDLSFDGSSMTNFNWFKMSRVRSCRFDNLEFRDTLNTVLTGEKFEDTVLHDIVFDNCGSETLPVINLTYAAVTGSETIAGNASKSLRFSAVQWKKCKSVACNLYNTNGIFFHGCTLENIDPNFSAQIRIENAEVTSLSGCRLKAASTNTAALIKAIASTGLLVEGSHLDGSNFAGIELSGATTKENAVCGNVFKNVPSADTVKFTNSSATANSVVANNLLS